MVLGPAETFSRAAGRLAALGHAVTPVGAEDVRVWRLDRCEHHSGLVVLEPPPRPPRCLTSLPPTATSTRLPDIPRIDQAWVGGPIRLAGVTCERGIGMHAPAA